jgi:uncharacterized secreted protein with C-terminal beta-propeller domain
MSAQRITTFTVSICLSALTLAAFDKEERTRLRQPRDTSHRLAPTRPALTSSSLTALKSCEDVRLYLIDVAVERILEYRYGWWYGPGGVAWGSPEETDRPADYTTTNIQEAGVDEIDIVKTNGTHLYVTEGETLHILRSWPATEMTELTSTDAPDWAHGLFLRDDRALVASRFWSSDPDASDLVSGTRLQLLDVSDPALPAELRTVDIEGWLVDARLIEGDLYAVFRSHIDLPPELWDLGWDDEIGLPDLPWDAPEHERERILDEARSILFPLVTEIIDRHGVDGALPRISDRNPLDPDAPPRQLLECSSLFRPHKASTWAVLSVVHLDLDEPGPVSATGLMSDGWTVYASKSNLYVAQTSDWWWWGWGWEPTEMTTAIHKFELGPSQAEPVRYAASGRVDGWILDQFALSEHNGYLRVAATDFDWWWGTTEGEENTSSVTVLADDGRGKLHRVGHVGGLGPGERIFAVRFLGDKGYVVTFEQIDPLFTLDLSDPEAPAVIGELEITGFSSYLHPIGDEYLLAIGQEADEEGRVIGMAVSIFDVRDFADPKLAHRYLIEDDEASWSWSEALSDHHAFTFHRGVLSLPAYISGEERFSGMLVFSVDPTDGISEIGRIDHQDLGTSDNRAWMRRSVYIEDAIYSISSAGVKVNHLENPEAELARVAFE